MEKWNPVTSTDQRLSTREATPHPRAASPPHDFYPGMETNPPHHVHTCIVFCCLCLFCLVIASMAGTPVGDETTCG